MRRVGRAVLLAAVLLLSAGAALSFDPLGPPRVEAAADGIDDLAARKES